MGNPLTSQLDVSARESDPERQDSLSGETIDQEDSRDSRISPETRRSPQAAPPPPPRSVSLTDIWM
jgi:hypothetical protein